MTSEVLNGAVEGLITAIFFGGISRRDFGGNGTISSPSWKAIIQ